MLLPKNIRLLISLGYLISRNLDIMTSFFKIWDSVVIIVSPNSKGFIQRKLYPKIVGDCSELIYPTPCWSVAVSSYHAEVSNSSVFRPQGRGPLSERALLWNYTGLPDLLSILFWIFVGRSYLLKAWTGLKPNSSTEFWKEPCVMQYKSISKREVD